MQIASPTSAPTASLALFQHAAPNAGGTEEERKEEPISTPVAAATATTDSVTVRGVEEAEALALQRTETVAPPPEIFAEIWKDGVKVGAVYTDGQAKLPSAVGMPPMTGNGALYARLRAEEISRQVGGEVRYVNMQALQVEQTRAQLRAAYGA